MFKIASYYALKSNNLTTLFQFVEIRHLSSSQMAIALRPFYFAVHPDLFGQYPIQRATNENSLKQLSSIIEGIENKGTLKPITLPFYLKDKDKGTFQHVKIYLSVANLRDTIISILKTCNLSTEYVDQIPQPPKAVFKKQGIKINTQNMDFSKMNENDPIFGTYIMRQNIKKAQDLLGLKNWLKNNYMKAQVLSEKYKPLDIELRRLEKNILKKWEILDIQWSCGWNETHYRGCLQSFMSLAEQHPEYMQFLKGKVLVFAPFAGISLDGYVMLNSAEVRHNWLEIIKNAHLHSAVIARIPNFEKALSQVLRNIKIGRRKYKIIASDYEKNLQQITTSLSDYLSYRQYPKTLPETLENFEIFLENEAGPLMVSPTGQFIVPCSLPGQLLVSFLTSHLEEAKIKSKQYNDDRHKELYLQTKCAEDFNLKFLKKDDNVTPQLMIKCCEQLLLNKAEIQNYLKGTRLNISTYYSVLSDGAVCIPWNFHL